MKGDFSRDTFVKVRHYNRVLMQQGRVQLDADWNEQQAIHRHHVETEGRDVIGKCGAPNDNPGFEIKVDENDKTKLKIGAGRYYVDGILCENEDEKEVYIYYNKQPDLPNPPNPIDLLSDQKAPLGLVYLDVWNRHITTLDDSQIREKALGGPDSTTRIKTVWQVKILPLKRFLDRYGGITSEEKEKIIEAQNCNSEFDEWDELIKLRQGTLNARTEPLEKETPCYLPPQSGYRGPENQLYRIEVHNSGKHSEATFKWSRDNGSIVTAIEGMNGTSITVSDLGKDNVLCFGPNQWAEISDDATELNELPGMLVQIKSVDYQKRMIEIYPPVPVYNFDSNLHPKLRRWDQEDGSSDGLKISVQYQDLEKGIQVQFSRRVKGKIANYKTGDYWLIPARAAIGDIEWPPYEVPNKTPIAQQRSGIYHHYCRLALICPSRDRQHSIYVKDCRKIFSPLSGEEGTHVTDVRVIYDEEYYHIDNDEEVGVDETFKGLRMIFDKDLEDLINYYKKEFKQPNPICFFTLYIPFPFPPINDDAWIRNIKGYQNITLNASVEAKGNIIDLMPAIAAKTWLIGDLFKAYTGSQLSRVLARLTLRGNFLWAKENGEDDSKLYLDGEVFRNKKNQDFRINLPSGDGRKGGDFEMWFWLKTRPPLELEMNISNSPIEQGGSTNITVKMKNRKAPLGGATIKLYIESIVYATNNVHIDMPYDSLIIIPETLAINDGLEEGAFSAKSIPPDYGPQVNVEIKATYGGAEATKIFQVLGRIG